MATAVAVARLRNLTVAPRKVRLVADLIRGKKVAEARGILNYTFKRSALPLRKLLDSAAANAEHKASEDGLRIDTEEMVITKVLVDEGMSIQRWRAMPRGRGVRIRKRRSHIEITLTGTTIAPKKETKRAARASAQAEAKE